MEKIILKTDLSCPHCVKSVEPILKNTTGIADYSIDLEHPDKLVAISSEGVNIKEVISKFNAACYRAEKV